MKHSSIVSENKAIFNLIKQESKKLEMTSLKSGVKP